MIGNEFKDFIKLCDKKDREFSSFTNDVYIKSGNGHAIVRYMEQGIQLVCIVECTEEIDASVDLVDIATIVQKAKHRGLHIEQKGDSIIVSILETSSRYKLRRRQPIPLVNVHFDSTQNVDGTAIRFAMKCCLSSIDKGNVGFMSGLTIEEQGEYLFFFGTDGRRASYAKLRQQEQIGIPDTGILLSREAIEKACKLAHISFFRLVTGTNGIKYAVLGNDHTVLICTQLAYEITPMMYQNNLVPNLKYEGKCSISKRHLLESLRMATALENKLSNGSIDLHFGVNELTLHYWDDRRKVEAKTEVQCSCDREVAFCFDIAYLIDGLNSVQADDIVLSLPAKSNAAMKIEPAVMGHIHRETIVLRMVEARLSK